MDLHDLIPDLDEQLAADRDVNDGLDKFMEDEVIPVWRDNSPVDTGEYRDSIKVTKPAEGGRGQVGTDDPKARYIEYGTNDTPEFAPRAKTQAHFNHGATPPTV